MPRIDNRKFLRYYFLEDTEDSIPIDICNGCYYLASFDVEELNSYKIDHPPYKDYDYWCVWCERLLIKIDD